MKPTTPRPPQGWRNRVAWVFLGIAATVLLFEVFFRVAGAGIRWARSLPASGPGSRHTILCEGDSFTYGIGGAAYPAQLEAILNRRAGKKLFRVVNKGVPGLNTAILADELEKDILKYQPDALFVIVGDNNSWNSIRLEAPSPELPWSVGLDRALLHSRAYKFAKLLLIGLRHSNFHTDETEDHLGGFWRKALSPDGRSGFAFPPMGMVTMLREAQRLSDLGEYGRALPLYREMASRFPREDAGHSGTASCLMKDNRLDEAIVALQQGAALVTPTRSYQIFFQLGWAHARKGAWDDARKAWQEGLTRFPRSRSLFDNVARACLEQGDLGKALELVRDIPGIRSNRSYARLAALRAGPGPLEKPDVARLMERSFRNDVRRLCALSKRHGVRLVLASYPDSKHPEVYEVAAEEGVAFVDFTAIFKARFKSRAEYISGDSCHCNTAGYAVMAETFADQVKKLLGPRTGS